ncbi:MAG: adenylate/guanylate cyclase domain-containing protein, partial [Bacteroidota bacterium]
MTHVSAGTITFLFSDIEGSTQLLHRLGERYATVLADQQRLLREAFQQWGGREIDTAGDGFFVAFDSAKRAVAAAVTAQRAVAAHTWPGGVSVKVRMGLHTGEPAAVGSGYVGIDVHRASRICSSGYGGQILLSQTTRELAAHDLTEGTQLRDLGLHRLKDLVQPEHLYQIVIPGLHSEFPALKTLSARPNNLPLQTTEIIGRDGDVNALRKLTMKPDVRLVTLTGPGGTGKTRLGLHLAAQVVEEAGEAPLPPTAPRWVPTVCLQCDAGCGIRVKVVQGKAIKIEGNTLFPTTQGGVCPKGQAA